MGKTPVVFRAETVDPSLDEIPLRQMSARPLITCGVIAGIGALLACGGLMFVSARSGSSATPAPSATLTPDSWDITGTALAGWTETPTSTATATPSETPTATATLDDWDMTGTAIFWLTYTPTSTATPSSTPTNTPRPTSDGTFFPGIDQWLVNVRGTLQARRTELDAYATVTAQAITPTGTIEPRIEYIEVTRIVGGGSGAAPAPDVRYIEVTPQGYEPPRYATPWPTYYIVPLPSPNPTYYIWLTWTKTPTPTGTLSPTPTASATQPATATTPPTLTATASATNTPEPPTATTPPTATPTPTYTPTSTETATDAPPPDVVVTETLSP